MKIEFIPLKKSTDMPVSHCTRCFKKLETASSVTHFDAPSPGDITLCVYCGNIMRFGDDLKPRDPTPEEMAEIQRSEAWPEVKELQQKFRNAEAAAVFKRDPKKP